MSKLFGHNLSDFKLTLEDGSVELLKNGRQVWASDSDEDFVEEFGEDCPDKNALALDKDRKSVV